MRSVNLRVYFSDKSGRSYFLLKSAKYLSIMPSKAFRSEGAMSSISVVVN